ncbi:hypothetical protein GCM10010965_10630 [Caldalkalibacillus thermarum]|nr:hypothetical protein GCM10010965_10630 [Caldalkalibacillus thermarum]
MVAPKEQARLGESLRQKDPYRTHLWRAFSTGFSRMTVIGPVLNHQRGNPEKGKLSGARTETKLPLESI